MPVKGVDGNGSDKKDGNERLRHNCVFFSSFSGCLRRMRDREHHVFRKLINRRDRGEDSHVSHHIILSQGRSLAERYIRKTKQNKTKQEARCYLPYAGRRPRATGG